jgi:hypothetical protein
MTTNILFISFLFISLSGCKTDNRKTMSQQDFAAKFVKSFAAYKMDIQAAGIAGIPSAELANDNRLTIEYSYHSEGENRKGKMTLQFVPTTNRFEGNWKTDADNGNVYQGSLHLSFKENGEADGFYLFEGENYRISIFLPASK